ncbi:hypothetical protein AKJ56_00540 [candidate division MSBL1 archaeon SCGC-AAA382N08]|uniref:Major facilitator superfamily (MFS) profile domain-containing protein n=1 Tax=candidate division MSBL1 archaeon SCGC-AAA382N08 TaxID=1698285 RepID=A0A133VQF5_9EURY|nr:hypothetical protein AKJ56_00540 [candidate division MSBL1 archaeon SCGC-AAA382N08]
MKKQLKGEVVILSLFHFMHHLYGLSLPPLFPLLKNHFGIGNIQVGLVVSMISITMAVFQLPLGLYSDKFGRKKILSVCFSIMLAAVFFTSISFAFWMVLLFQIILGIGMSGYHPVGLSAIADLFPGKETGKAMSAQAIGGSLGVALAPIILGGLASFYGWRVPLRIIAFAGIPALGQKYYSS